MTLAYNEVKIYAEVLLYVSIIQAFSLSVVTVVYIAAFFAGLIVFRLFDHIPLLGFFLADIAATIVVWLLGIIYKNASMYDPYWSVVPLVLMIGFLSVSQELGVVSILYLFVFAFWGVRLTLNWALGWQGLRYQDWRYTMLKQKSSKLWFFTNLFGINLMPTLIVFAAMLPAYFVSLDGYTLSVPTILGVLLCICAVTLQIVSDTQMRRFRYNPANAGKNMQSGLWAYSRHPNYLGEITLWWGIWAMQIGVLPGQWWTVFAPVLMTALFVLVSIPMMEQRLTSTKNGYSDYQSHTSMLLLLPKISPIYRKTR